MEDKIFFIALGIIVVIFCFRLPYILDKAVIREAKSKNRPSTDQPPSVELLSTQHNPFGGQRPSASASASASAHSASPSASPHSAGFSAPTYHQQPHSTPPLPASTPPAQLGLIAKLKELKSLLDQGILTELEFAAAKEKILGMDKSTSAQPAAFAIAQPAYAVQGGYGGQSVYAEVSKCEKAVQFD